MRYSTRVSAVLLGVALAATATLTACSDTASSGDSPTAPNSVSVNPTFNNVDAMFAQMMIPHHQQAVEMAALAETKATDPDVKQLAAKISTEQKAEIATMKGWLVAWGQPTTMPSCPGMHCMPSNMMPSGKAPSGMMPSGTMPSGMPTMPGMMSSAEMAKLKAATGTDFDKLFLQMMIVHHQGAVMMAQAELAHGTNPDAKALAGRIVKTQQAEIVAMQQMAGTLHS